MADLQDTLVDLAADPQEPEPVPAMGSRILLASLLASGAAFALWRGRRAAEVRAT